MRPAFGGSWINVNVLLLLQICDPAGVGFIWGVFLQTYDPPLAGSWISCHLFLATSNDFILTPPEAGHIFVTTGNNSNLTPPEAGQIFVTNDKTPSISFGGIFALLQK